MRTTIFVGGVHGVGKTTFCAALGPVLSAEHVTASSLIRKCRTLDSSKLVSTVQENQRALIEAYRELETTCGRVLLDGHFCLLNKTKEVERVPDAVFRGLSVDMFLMLIAPEEEVERRLSTRVESASGLDLETLRRLQAQEVQHAQGLAESLAIPLLTVDVGKDLTPHELAKLAENIRQHITL
jgi:adenylate kinase